MNAPAAPSYLLAGQQSELDRLQLQSRVWEPAGERLLALLELPPPARVLDVGCGAMGWLRALARRVGPGGRVTGTDIDERMLAAARGFVEAEGLQGVRVERDDLFDSLQPGGAFDLVHARFQIAPLGRAEEQLRAYLRLVAPGGWLVLEDPDAASWHLNPDGPATGRLVALILQAFRAGGGDFDAGRQLPALMRAAGLEPQVRAEVVALEPGHPYLRLPVQFATALRPRLEQLLPAPELADLMAQCEQEIAQPGAWGTTFTLVQAWARSPR
jgi:SAM-dependent methyltransferase